MDPYSGQPEAKAPCAIEPIEFALRGCAQTRGTLALRRENLWARVPDAVVCACFGTDEESIRCAIGKGAHDTADIGKLLGAGTNCGSCLPELKRIIRHERALATQS